MTLDLLIPTFDPATPRSAIENMKLLADNSTADILAFIHSDVDILDDTWQQQVIDFLDSHPKCGLVGFGGALGLGLPQIYKVPYDFRQLARISYRSNQKDWEIHGAHLTQPERVTMLDGFALIFRREAYEGMGGWQAALDLGLSFHFYDGWACCMMERKGWEVWALPIHCWHHGGGTSISKEYDEWLHSQGIQGDVEIHQKAHVIMYNEFKDILPWRLQNGR